MGILDKFSDLKFEVEWQARKIRQNVSQKFDDVKDFVEDRVEDVKDFAGDKLKPISKGDVAELASNVLFPAQIPVKLIFSSVGKGAASKIKDKNGELSERVLLLEAMQGQGEMLEKDIKSNLSNIQSNKISLQVKLVLFANVFEKIHNRPTFDIHSGEYIFTSTEFNAAAPNADFARFDGFLVDMYDEEAGILQGLFRTPVFAAILKFREKALINKIDDVLSEVNDCINNMRKLIQYLIKVNVTSRHLLKELRELELVLSQQIDKLSSIVDKKTDFRQFTEQEITILDTNIKLVAIIVELMNTHIFNTNGVKDNGFTQVNTNKVNQKIKESEKLRGNI